MRTKIFSVTIDDCEVQTFRVSGNGGQKVNKTESGVRVIHHPSGARGECTETRSQYKNKRTAFIRMTETKKFKVWLMIATGRLKSDEQLEKEIDQELANPNRLRVEVKDDKGRWITRT